MHEWKRRKRIISSTRLETISLTHRRRVKEENETRTPKLQLQSSDRKRRNELSKMCRKFTLNFTFFLFSDRIRMVDAIVKSNSFLAFSCRFFWNTFFYCRPTKLCHGLWQLRKTASSKKPTTKKTKAIGEKIAHKGRTQRTWNASIRLTFCFVNAIILHLKHVIIS